MIEQNTDSFKAYQTFFHHVKSGLKLKSRVDATQTLTLA